MPIQYEITGGHAWTLTNHTFNPRLDTEDAAEIMCHNGDVVTYAGWTSSYFTLVKTLYANKWFIGVIPATNLMEIVPLKSPAPVDRGEWRDGIEQVQAYLPAISENVWRWMEVSERPLYDGLRKMQANGPDNDN